MALIVMNIHELNRFDEEVVITLPEWSSIHTDEEKDKYQAMKKNHECFFGNTSQYWEIAKFLRLMKERAFVDKAVDMPHELVMQNIIKIDEFCNRIEKNVYAYAYRDTEEVEIETTTKRVFGMKLASELEKKEIEVCMWNFYFTTEEDKTAFQLMFSGGSKV